MPIGQVVMYNTIEHCGIVIYRNFITNPEEMIQFILAAEQDSKLDNWSRAKVVKPEGNEEDSWRTNDILVLPNKDVLAKANVTDPGALALADLSEQINQVFKACLSNYMHRFNFSLKEGLDKGYQVLRYSGGGEYKGHMDDGPLTPRRVSGLLYLNGNFEGGELNFPYLNFTYKPYGGDVLLFPSGVPYMHAAKPVTEGTKYSVVSWWF